MRLTREAIRTVRTSIETEVKTGAYDVLNSASGALLHGREDGPSDASRERIQEIHEELVRATKHVEEYLDGPTTYEKRSNDAIFEELPQWEKVSLGSMIGADGMEVQRTQKMEPPSARSHNGNSRAEQERRNRAFGSSEVSRGSMNANYSSGKGTGANAVPLGSRR